LKRGLRITVRILGSIVALFILLWVVLWAYVTYNKAGIIKKVKAGISKQVNGKVEIGDLSIDFFHNFPNVAVRLTDVTVRDSLWEQHHHDFLKAGSIYARLQVLSLLSGNPVASKVIVENAQIYYYTDSTGYSNLIKAKGNPGKKEKPDIPEFLFRNTRVIIDHASRHKFHDVELKTMDCRFVNTDSGRLIKINMNALVHRLAFNDAIGNYLKEKNISGDFDVLVNTAKQVKLNDVKLKIDDHPFSLSGIFSTGIDSPHFSLSIQTKKIGFKKAIGLLTETTQKAFVAYDVSQPMDISADLHGSLAFGSIPLARVSFRVDNADVQSPAGLFNSCVFNGYFLNENDPSLPRDNSNSMVQLQDFSGKWQKIPLTAKRINVTHLDQPFLDCDLQSVFSLADLDELTGSNSIHFISGTGQMNVAYKGSLVSNDTTALSLDGSIHLSNADVSYVPRNMTLKNMQANIVFKHKDVFIQQLQAQAGATDLNMNGSVKNLIGLIYNSPEKLILDWNISTPYLDLVDFIGFLGKKSTVTTQRVSARSRVMHVAAKIDNMLQNGTAQLKVQAAKVKYKKFNASNFNTSVSLLNDQILLNSATLNHAGGTITMNGSLLDEGAANSVSLRSNINNVDIPTILHAFNNFGQDAITESNMKGRLTATVNLTAALTEKAVLKDQTLSSVVNFSVKDAELNDFEPFKKIAVSVFKKRDFSHVRFAELKNKLEVSGTAINVNKMEIHSNVFTMFVEGVYDTKKGTDMAIMIPLSNLKKVDDDEVLVNKGKAGVNLRLHAKTGDDGKLKISWNPLAKITNIFKKKSP